MKYLSITVLMTTYNCAPFLKQAIRSILNQTFKDFEFLIIDDGSTDETEDFVKQFSDKRICYLKTEHNGRAKALNYGLQKSSNDVIALMDSDDIAHPDRLEKQIRILQNDERFVIVTDGAYFNGSKIIYKTDIPNNPDKFNRLLLLHGTFFHPTMMFYKNHVLKMGGYNENLIANEDHDLWLRLKDGSIFIILKNELYYYRYRKNSLSNTAFLKNPNITYKIQEQYFQDLQNTLKLKTEFENIELRGWREYFYGNKKLARGYWLSVKLNNWDYKMVLAFFLTFFPKLIVNYFKSLRLRLRLEYFLNRNRKYKGLDSEFRKLLLEVEK
jgi:glycosyltransferase involved in cell wall biosynthesis